MGISTAIMENSMDIPQKIKIKLSEDSAIPLVGIYSRERKSGSHRGTCPPMFTVALIHTRQGMENYMSVHR